MKRADAVVEGGADLVCVQLENETMVLDLLFRSSGVRVSQPLTLWVARSSDEDLTWAAERQLHQWSLAGSDIALSLQLAREEPRALLEGDDARITFELVGCAGLPG